MQLKAVERWKAEMPSEAEMLPKDKYTVFARNERGYRKGIHSTDHLMAMEWALANVWTEVPKWTRISQRINPPGY